jgi:hypothetical protein
MAIISDLARMAEQVGYHRITSGDTATDLSDWLATGDFAPGPDGFVIDNEDGTFGIWGSDATAYQTGTIGDYVLHFGGLVASPSTFAARYVVPVSVLGA